MVRPSYDKLRELIIYVSSKYSDDETYNSTRLTKVLFWSDFEFFQATGDAITGSNYIRMPHGPMLEKFQGVLQGMETKGELVVLKPAGEFARYRPVPQRAPDLSLFNKRELAVIDRIIAENYGASATSVSRTSHDFMGWQIAKQGERIPYGMMWLEVPDILPEDIEYAHELGRLFGLE